MNNSKRKAGRPRTRKKAITEQELLDERKRHVQTVLNRRKNHKEEYNKYMREYKQRKRKEATDIFKPIRDQLLFDDYKISLNRMATLIKIGCVEKKSKGRNYIGVSHKKNHKFIMSMIGFNEQKDIWVSSSWVQIPMHILKWNDIKLHKINYHRMVIYGVLNFILDMPKQLALIVLEYTTINKEENKELLQQLDII